MKKQDLIRELAGEMKMNQREATALLEATIEELTQLLAKGESVSFYGFGSFSVTRLEKRKGFNPLLPKWMMLPPKLKASFKPSDSLRERINKGRKKTKKTTARGKGAKE